MFRKRFKTTAIVMTLIIFVLMVFFNGGKKEKAPVEEVAVEEDIFAEPVELIFWWYGEEESPGIINYVQQLCDDYHKMHPNITVTQVHQGVDVLIPNFQAAYEAQSGPDIACLWGGLYLLEWVWQDAFVPLNDYVDEEELSHWIGSKFSEYDGKIYGSDLEVHANFTVYYKDHFVDAGLDPDTPPATWNDLVEYSAKLKAAGHIPYAVGFGGGWQTPVFADFMWPYFISFGEIAEVVIGNRAFNEPDFVDFWEKLDSYNKAGYFIEGATSIDWIEAWNEWRAGKATFLSLPGQSAMSFIDELGTDKVGYFVFPAISDKKLVHGLVWPTPHSITIWSKHKELAADFLVYFHAEENYPKLLDAVQTHNVPADDRFDPSVVRKPENAKWYAEMAINGLKENNYLAEAALPWTIIDKGLIQGGQALILGELDAQGAADNMEQAAKEWRELNPEMLEFYKTWAAKY